MDTIEMIILMILAVMGGLVLFLQLTVISFEGRMYEEDKPWSCKYCYFWEGKNKGCGLDECYYLISADGSVKESKPPMVGNCSRCPYGKHSPCIGYCIAKLQCEMKERKKQGKGDQL